MLIFFAKENDYKELMILGGGHVYEQTINEADKIHITRVHHVFEDADAFFLRSMRKNGSSFLMKTILKMRNMLMITVSSYGNENNC